MRTLCNLYNMSSNPIYICSHFCPNSSRRNPSSLSCVSCSAMSSDDELPPPVVAVPQASPQPTRTRPPTALVQPPGIEKIRGCNSGVQESVSAGHVKEATQDDKVIAFIGCHGKRRKRFSLTKFGDNARSLAEAWIATETSGAKQAASMSLQLPGTASDTPVPKVVAGGDGVADAATSKKHKADAGGAIAAVAAKRPKKEVVVKTAEETAAIEASVRDLLSQTTATRTSGDEKWVEFCKRRLPLLAKQFPGEKSVYMKIASGEYRRPVQ